MLQSFDDRDHDGGDNGGDDGDDDDGDYGNDGITHRTSTIISLLIN